MTSGPMRGGMELARRSALVAAVLLLCAAVAPSAAAQTLTPYGVTLSSASTSLTSSDGACVAFAVTVQNTGQFPSPGPQNIDITMALSSSAWDVEQAPPPTEPVAPGESGSFTVELCPGDEVGDGESVQAAFTATVREDPRSPKAQGTLTVTVTAEDDRIFGLNVPNVVLWVALGAIVALVGLVIVARSRPSGGVAIACPEASKAVAPGRGTSYPIRIRNEGRTRDVVTLTTSPVPSGWDTFLPLADVPLEAKEEQTVWLSVKSPEGSHPGDHAVVQVIARSTNTAGEQARIDTLTTVAAPHERAPPAPPAPPQGGSTGDVEFDESVVAEERAASSKPVAVKRRKKSA